MDTGDAVVWRNRAMVLFDRIPMPVAVCDPYGDVRLVNAAFALEWGTTAGRLKGRSILDLFAPVDAAQVDRITQAQKTGDPNLANLQKQLTAITAQRDTLFKGETLRGLLLTSFGFSVFGDKAGQAALVSYLAAALLALLSIAGFAHALIIPKTRTFAAVEPNPALSAA